ncbi:MAG: MBL fold metallo-hydrolase [Deltaproteobacteria bacterium]|nr:MBL fold metallo-hydrolase [Deltaproteobacteria bacterium]
MTRAPIQNISENLFLIDLDLPLPGFRRFISTWVIKADDRAIVIDPGPCTTVPMACDALKGLGVKGIDYVLLTHIHLDHAGGCGDLIARYPEPTVVCHPQAVDHLADPERLWRGSVKALGDLARTYGEPTPINREKLCPGCDIQWKGYRIEALETPGHASHHMCFFLEDIVLAGEVSGVRIPSGNPPYRRPATPHPFQPEVALRSITKVIEHSPKRICYGHYGIMENAVIMLESAREQIELWLDIIERRRDKGLELDEEEILEEILSMDPGVRSFHQLEPDIRERETYFIKNSIRGMVGFIRAKPHS